MRGYCVDLLMQLASPEKMNFDYEIIPAAGNKYGSSSSHVFTISESTNLQKSFHDFFFLQGRRFQFWDQKFQFIITEKDTLHPPKK